MLKISRLWVFVFGVCLLGSAGCSGTAPGKAGSAGSNGVSSIAPGSAGTFAAQQIQAVAATTNQNSQYALYSDDVALLQSQGMASDADVATLTPLVRRP